MRTFLYIILVTAVIAVLIAISMFFIMIAWNGIADIFGSPYIIRYDQAFYPLLALMLIGGSALIGKNSK